MDINLMEHKSNILPDDLKKEALDFIDYLIMKKNTRNFQLNLISHGKVVWLILKAGILLSNYSINQWSGDNVFI